MSRTTIVSLRLFCIAVVIAILAVVIVIARRSTGVLPNESVPVANEGAKVDRDHQSPSAGEATPQTPSSVGQAKPETSIRKIDFNNFTYPWTKDLLSPGKAARKTFRLKEGELAPTRDEVGVYMIGVYYADVTGDNAEDAVVVLYLRSGGSAMPNVVYVYGFQDSKLRLLWAFSTGDRAEKGLRNVYAENGILKVELYSPEDNHGDCCPLYYTRTSYQWTGKRFDQKGVESLPNPDENASLRFHPNGG